MAHHQLPIPSLREQRPDVPEALDAVFQRMMCKRPTDRYRSMTEVLGALQACRLVDAHHLVRIPDHLPERSADGLTLGNLQEGATLMLEKPVAAEPAFPLPQTARIAPVPAPPVNDIVGVVMDAMNLSNVDLNDVRLEDVKRLLVEALRRAR